MRIYVDADACPVVRQTEKIAEKYNVPVTLICDTNHMLSSGYSDIVVSQDYGVAAMALGKGAYPIHQNGRWYTNENIDELLMQRHMAKAARRKGKNHLKGPKKRTAEDDARFMESLERLVIKLLEK